MTTERAATRPSTRTETLDPAPPTTGVCPACAAPLTGQTTRFCEGCGLDRDDVDAGAPVALRWIAEVRADRDHFDRVAADGMTFPEPAGEVTIALEADEITIGRGRPPAPAPGVDLSGAVADPAVSHHHATLLRTAVGSYELVDVGSTNGTSLNDEPALLSPGAPIELADGDRIHLGAWTTITVRLAPPA